MPLREVSSVSLSGFIIFTASYRSSPIENCRPCPDRISTRRSGNVCIWSSRLDSSTKNNMFIEFLCFSRFRISSPIVFYSFYLNSMVSYFCISILILYIYLDVIRLHYLYNKKNR